MLASLAQMCHHSMVTGSSAAGSSAGSSAAGSSAGSSAAGSGAASSSAGGASVGAATGWQAAMIMLTITNRLIENKIDLRILHFPP